MIRLSVESDKEEIKHLVELCFGNRLHCGYLNNLSGRYLLKIVEGNIVAMSGLNNNTPYENGLEVDWTCTHPNYRKCGYMHEIFEQMIPLTNGNIYCSCWHLEGKENVELYSLMRDFNFECIKPAHKIGKSNECNCFNITDCVNYNLGCTCQEDLYIRKSLGGSCVEK